jgi:UDP-glucose 4-epimerase
MILIECADENNNSRQIVALFGIGLIGRSIVQALSRMEPCKVSTLSFTWNAQNRQLQELGTIEDLILASCHQDAMPPVSRIDFIWAAGHSGFASSEDDLIPEMSAFENVLSFCRQVSNQADHIQHSFHLISSAGGLFEGQRHIDRTSVPRPLRPYSHAKLHQEQRLSELPARMRRMIYRLSSVYGFSGKGIRFGMINTLIRNSIRHQSSNIFGNALTIRDYVLAADVGQYVAKRVRDIDASSSMFILASGKPTSIFEILNRIESIVCRRLLYSFNQVRTNAADISFSPTILPKFWYPTDLETGLRQTVSVLASSLAIS